MRRIAVCLCLLMFTGSTAMAAEPAKEPAKKSDAAAGASVTMPYLIAPLSDGGTLVAYAYISSKIVGTSQATALEIQGKIPFIQDAFVRDVNASSIAKPGNPMAVDNTVLQARLLALTKKVMGPGKVADLKILQVQITPMRPGAVAPASPS
jgi:hypothetical protein